MKTGQFLWGLLDGFQYSGTRHPGKISPADWNLRSRVGTACDGWDCCRSPRSAEQALLSAKGDTSWCGGQAGLSNSGLPFFNRTAGVWRNFGRICNNSLIGGAPFYFGVLITSPFGRKYGSIERFKLEMEKRMTNLIPLDCKVTVQQCECLLG